MTMKMRLLLMTMWLGLAAGAGACRCGGGDSTAVHADGLSSGAAPGVDVAATGALRTAGGVELPATLPAEAATALTRAPMDTDDAADALHRAGPSFAPLARALASSASVDDLVVGAAALAAFARDGTPLQLNPEVLQRLLDHPAPALAAPALALAAAAGRHDVLIARIEATTTPPSLKLALLDNFHVPRVPPDSAVVDALVRCTSKETFDAVAEGCASVLAEMRRAGASGDLAQRLRELRRHEPLTVAILVATTPDDADDPAADSARLDTVIADVQASLPLRALATRQRLEFGAENFDAARLGASSALGLVRADVVDDAATLSSLVTDADRHVRAAAIATLARLTPVEARRALLVPHLDDADPAVRRATIATVAALLPLDEAVAVLSTRLQATEDPDQAHIIAALRTIPDRQAVDALIAALDQPHSRPGAWYALVTLSGEAPENADAAYWRAWRDRRFGAASP